MRIRFQEWKKDVFQDWRVNNGRSKSQLILVLFRQTARWHRATARPWHQPGAALYTVIVNWIFGVEIPPATKVGTELQVFHAQTIIVNPETVIGDRCIIRASTVLGNISDRGGSAGNSPIIGDDVELGVGVTIIGAVQIGDRARIGAGAVVTKDVPSGAVAVGNPARVLDS